jgi:hypothetical protein
MPEWIYSIRGTDLAKPALSCDCTGEGGPYDKDDPSEIGITRRRMFNAMRVDLGEPGEDLGNLSV